MHILSDCALAFHRKLTNRASRFCLFLFVSKLLAIYLLYQTTTQAGTDLERAWDQTLAQNKESYRVKTKLFRTFSGWVLNLWGLRLHSLSGQPGPLPICPAWGKSFSFSCLNLSCFSICPLCLPLPPFTTVRAWLSVPRNSPTSIGKLMWGLNPKQISSLPFPFPSK